MDEQNNPVIADWGLGQFIHQESKVLDFQTQGGIGTSYYCPMEQWTTGRCEASGDVYSLGVMLAELAAGRRLPINPPFSGIQQDIVANDSVQSRNFNMTIRFMTHFDAKKRYATMAQVAAALANCV